MTSAPQGFQAQGHGYRARISHPKMGDTSGLQVRQGRGHVSIANSLDT